MMMARPMPAIGVRIGLMRVAAGRIMPSAPAISEMPMKRISHGRSAAQFAPCLTSASMGCSTFGPPAKRNIPASSDCATHSPMLRARFFGFEVVELGLMRSSLNHGAIALGKILHSELSFGARLFTEVVFVVTLSLLVISCNQY
jgi:hypothetical protein